MNSIILSAKNGRYIEGTADSAFQPGRFCRWGTTKGVLEYDGGGVDTALPMAGMIIVEDSLTGKDYKEVYSVGENVRTMVLQSGSIVYARTSNAQTIGDKLGINVGTQNGLLTINVSEPQWNQAQVLEPGLDQGDGTFLTKVHIN